MPLAQIERSAFFNLEGSKSLVTQPELGSFAVYFESRFEKPTILVVQNFRDGR